MVDLANMTRPANPRPTRIFGHEFAVFVFESIRMTCIIFVSDMGEEN